jgi:hypothetical protein
MIVPTLVGLSMVRIPEKVQYSYSYPWIYIQKLFMKGNPSVKEVYYLPHTFATQRPPLLPVSL